MMRSVTIRSKNFAKQGRTEIGLKLLKRALSPDLNIGTTRVIFISSETNDNMC